MEKRPTLVWQYVDYWAAVKPYAEAIVFNERRMTWAELAEAVDRTALALLDLGIEKGDRVALIAAPCPEFIITFMAASKISAIWTGLSPKFSIGEMGRILRDSRPAVLITQDRHEQSNLVERALTFSFEMSCIREVLVLGKTPENMQSFDNFIMKDRPGLKDLLRQRISQAVSSDETLLMFTSGSSGFPKGVLHTHASILSNVEQERQLFDFSEDTRILLHFPINHVAADVEIGVCAVYAGACLVMMEGFDASTSLGTIEKEKITLVGQVPAMYMLQLQDPAFKKTNWDSVRTFVWGGSPASQDMLQSLSRISKRTGARLVTGYGATELAGFVTATRPGDSLQQMRESVGMVYKNCQLRIVDENRKPLKAGLIGEVAVRGPILMKGYLNSPVLTSEVLDENGWYYTRDLGTLDPEGILYLHGRRSEMFKTGGENVFPCEIESILEAHSSILYAAVVAAPDPIYDEVCHAHIMTYPGQSLTETDVVEWCRKHLSSFKVPRKVFFHNAMPLLPNGKVDKLKLMGGLKGK